MSRVGIIGSGFSGIAAAIELQRRGIDFLIFELADGLGGTWWKNRYPGAEVDLESHIYSFSFAPQDWPQTHSSRALLQRYLQRVADEHGVTPKVQLGEKVERVVWDEQSSGYRITTSTGVDHGLFAGVVSAVGFLNIPLRPPFARGETPFKGVVCHTADWPEGLDMSDKRVGIVGTGSSAVQVAPEAEKVAESVKVFQLEANWVLPKEGRRFSPLERWLLRRSCGYKARRWWLYLRYDLRQALGGHSIEGTRPYNLRAVASKRFLERSLGDRPELLKMVTPDIPFEGRRVVLSDSYYETLRSDKVELVPHGVSELTANGVRDATGAEHELDVVVLATGFDAANYLGNFEVVGRGGVELHDVWQSEPEALLGTMVPGFPNFFIMYGPNTNSVPLVSFYEAQAKFAARLLAQMLRLGNATVEPRRRAFESYNAWLQRRLAKTVWAKAQNYFRASTGKVVSQWPLSASSYIVALRIAALIAVKFDEEEE